MRIAGSAPRNRRRRRRRQMKSLAFLPSIITLCNLTCGFAAVHFAIRAMYELGRGEVVYGTTDQPIRLIELMLPSFLSLGGGLVVLGMVFDAFDGLIARMTRSTTDFGGQLDSLADIVTFGVAPATLMVAFMTTQLANEAILPSPISTHVLGRFSWVCAALYVAFTAIRLARYNVEHARADFDPRAFRGLPSPGAGAIVVALIIFQDQEVGQPLRPFIVYALPIVALLTAFLMVSRLPYKRFHRALLLGNQPFGQFLGCVALLALFWLYKAPTLLFVVLWYWASGPIHWLTELIRSKRGDLQSPASSTVQQSDAQQGRPRNSA